jgi:ABC-2 type transport system ATP-binding protein
MEEAEYCHRLALMYRGRVIALGSPRELKDKLAVSSMEDVFIAMIEAADKEAA